MATAKFDKKFVWACCLVGLAFTMITVVVQYILGRDAGNIAGLFLAALAMGIFKQYPTLRFGRSVKGSIDVPRIEIFGPLESAAILFLLLATSVAVVLLVNYYTLLESGPFPSQIASNEASFRAIVTLKDSQEAGKNAIEVLWGLSFLAVGVIAGFRYPRFLAVFYSGCGIWAVMAIPTVVWAVLRLGMGMKGYRTEGTMELFNIGFMTFVLSAITMGSAAITSSLRKKK